jgi:phage shock protein A
MDYQAEADKALKRIKQLESEVESLKKRMDNQYTATEDLIRRVTKLESKARPLA